MAPTQQMNKNVKKRKRTECKNLPEINLASQFLDLDVSQNVTKFRWWELTTKVGETKNNQKDFEGRLNSSSKKTPADTQQNTYV